MTCTCTITLLFGKPDRRQLSLTCPVHGDPERLASRLTPEYIDKVMRDAPAIIREVQEQTGERPRRDQSPERDIRGALLRINDTLLGATNGSHMMTESGGKQYWATDVREVDKAREMVVVLLHEMDGRER